MILKHFHTEKRRTPRSVADERWQQVRELKLDYVPNDRFAQLSAAEEEAILGPAPEPRSPVKLVPRPEGISPYLASLYETPLLTREQERHLFRKMNYLKYRAAELRERLAKRRPSLRALERILRWHAEAVAIKKDIVRANLRLVVSIAKRYAPNPGRLFELISDGNVSLMRAVEKFDFALGFHFSTYATWAIVKNFSRTIPAELRQQGRFRATEEAWLLEVEDSRSSSAQRESIHSRRSAEVSRVLNHLNERERSIIRRRFGLEDNCPPMTLKELGGMMGVSKERIRQIETRAIAKLRSAAIAEGVASPENVD